MNIYEQYFEPIYEYIARMIYDFICNNVYELLMIYVCMISFNYNFFYYIIL